MAVRKMDAVKNFLTFDRGDGTEVQIPAPDPSYKACPNCGSKTEWQLVDHDWVDDSEIKYFRYRCEGTIFFWWGQIKCDQLFEIYQ